jgi:ribosomal-protein-alanine N-acetyltransferase
MRSLILKDAHDLYEIRKTSFEDLWSEKEFVSMLLDESFFGFREDRGFILCRRVLDNIDIVTFCVDPKYRRKGIGKNLLLELLEFARKNKCEIFLEVSEKNHIARNLYISLGFDEISIRKNYYKFKDGMQNAVVMKYMCI